MVWDPNNERQGTQEEWAFKSRTFTGQIRDVDETQGKIKVDLFGARQSYDLDIPVQGLSINGVRSSWQRYMPQVKEYVDVAFGPDGRPHAVRPTTWLLNKDHGGYAVVAKAAADDRNNLGLIWRKLRQGEFDLRSRGGAGYYFTADGHAILEAGPTAIELDKNRSESVGNAGLWVRKGDGVEARWGDVKRLLPGTYEETKVTPNPAGAVAPKEWSVDVGYPTPPLGAPALTFYSVRAGDVRDSLGVPVLHGSTALPLRYEGAMYDPSGLDRTLYVEVDALGNVEVTQGLLAAPLGMKISGGAASPLATQFFTTTIRSATTTQLVSDLPVVSPAIFFGEGAVHPYLLTNVWTPARATMNALLGTAHTADAAEQTGLLVLMAALTAFFAAYAAENPPPSPSGIAATAWAAALGAYAPLNAAAIAANTGAVAGIATFEGASLTYLSKHVLGV